MSLHPKQLLPRQRTTGSSDLAGVTVVIAHYGSVELTEFLVNDLRLQTYPKVQIVVSDDCSPVPYPVTAGVHVDRSPRNQGFGAAMNRGVRSAKYPWLLLLNSDVRVSPEFVARAMGRAAQAPPRLYGFSQQGGAGEFVPVAAPLPTVLSTLGQHSDAVQPLARRLGWTRAWSWESPDNRTTRRVGWVNGAAMLVPTSWFRHVGGFDERFFMYSEEVDLQRRLSAVGCPTYLMGELSIAHLGGASSGAIDRRVEQLRSRLLYEAVARGPRSRMRLVFGLRVVTELDYVYWLLRTLRRSDGPTLGSVSQRRQILRSAIEPSHR